MTGSTGIQVIVFAPSGREDRGVCLDSVNQSAASGVQHNDGIHASFTVAVILRAAPVWLRPLCRLAHLPQRQMGHYENSPTVTQTHRKGALKGHVCTALLLKPLTIAIWSRRFPHLPVGNVDGSAEHDPLDHLAAGRRGQRARVAIVAPQRGREQILQDERLQNRLFLYGGEVRGQRSHLQSKLWQPPTAVTQVSSSQTDSINSHEYLVLKYQNWPPGGGGIALALITALYQI